MLELSKTKKKKKNQRRKTSEKKNPGTLGQKQPG
jgi:hypothetical protein